MVAKRSERPATYADLEALPPNMVGEIVRGVLYASPRPASPHASSALGEELGPPFKRGRGGPGGWVILDEPELHFGEDVLVPDLGGWRRDACPRCRTRRRSRLRPTGCARCCRRPRRSSIAPRNYRSTRAAASVTCGWWIRSSNTWNPAAGRRHLPHPRDARCGREGARGALRRDRAGFDRALGALGGAG